MSKGRPFGQNCIKIYAHCSRTKRNDKLLQSVAVFFMQPPVPPGGGGCTLEKEEKEKKKKLFQSMISISVTADRRPSEACSLSVPVSPASTMANASP